MNKQQQRFIEDMGQLMVGWGLSRTTGRVYAYLLLRSAPASLDDLAADLGVAKSGASVATRQLIGFGMARTFGEGRGTRRLRYDALYDLDAIIAARSAQTLAFFERLHEGAKVASTPSVKRKITAMTGALEGLFAQAPALARRNRKRRSA
jgi:DNA-binding transcriptional regulator GbsR (MarR family)